jgi:hypothetical protein
VRVGTSHGVVARVKAGGSGFLSQSDPRLLFGLGEATQSGAIEVTWPSGLVQRLPGLAAGRSVLLVEGETAWRDVAEKAFRLPLPDAAPPAARSPASAPAGAVTDRGAPDSGPAPAGEASRR